MPTRARPSVASRKQPKQARSTQLVADILTAAAQVLARDGAHRFTTTRVAEKAGVSVGSLYQYFPNKEAVLFRLQHDEWTATAALLDRILSDAALAPRDRLRKAVREFFRTEWEEARMRRALGDAAPYYRDTPEATRHRQAGRRALQAFMRQAVPSLGGARRAVAADLIGMTLGAVGKSVSETAASPAQVDRYARAAADMLCAYLQRLSA